MAYMEMPEEKIVMKANERRSDASLLVEAHAQILRHRTGFGAVIERHHEDADKTMAGLRRSSRNGWSRCHIWRRMPPFR